MVWVAQVAVCSELDKLKKKPEIQCGKSVQLLNVKLVGVSRNQ